MLITAAAARSLWWVESRERDETGGTGVPSSEPTYRVHSKNYELHLLLKQPSIIDLKHFIPVCIPPHIVDLEAK